MLVCKRFLTLLLVFGILCHAAAADWQAFEQQLKQQTGESLREQRIMRMLARRLAHISQGGHIDDRDPHGQTALMMAAALNLEELAMRLLLKGADPSISTPKGKTAATLCTAPRLAALISACCENVPPAGSLHQAVQKNEAGFAEAMQLLRNGADVHARDKQGKTPLMLVSAHNREMAGLLIAAGADPMHWGQEERAGAKVQLIDVVFTHRGLSAEELEAEDKTHARLLDEQRQKKVRWRRFTDPAMRSRKRLSMPHSFTWDRKQRCHVSKDLLNKLKQENGAEGAGRSGYLGHVYLGTLTLHYPEGVPSLSFPVQCGGRAEHYLGSADNTTPIVPEGATARLFPDYRGHTLNGFFISCQGREAVPRFSEEREHIMLHMAPVAVPGETEETTLRTTGSHGCLSIKNPDHWKTICSELRKKGTATREGLELRIRYDVK